MTRKLPTLSLAALALLALVTTDAFARGWELLGRRTVDLKVDRDVLEVGRQDGRFQRIQLRVRENAIFMQDMKVVYGNGRVDDIPVRRRIRAGGETAAIDLKGDERNIRRIEFTYRSDPRSARRAVVEVYGWN